jgi:hypothetical protein
MRARELPACLETENRTPTRGRLSASGAEAPNFGVDRIGKSPGLNRQGGDYKRRRGDNEIVTDFRSKYCIFGQRTPPLKGEVQGGRVGKQQSLKRQFALAAAKLRISGRWIIFFRTRNGERSKNT